MQFKLFFLFFHNLDINKNKSFKNFYIFQKWFMYMKTIKRISKWKEKGQIWGTYFGLIDERMKYSVKNAQQIISISLFSHPKLLTVPSELFYEGELEPKADPFVTHSMLNWELLPNKKVPLVFHGVVGKKVLLSVGLLSFLFCGVKIIYIFGQNWTYSKEIIAFCK